MHAVMQVQININLGINVQKYIKCTAILQLCSSLLHNFLVISPYHKLKYKPTRFYIF